MNGAMNVRSTAGIRHWLDRPESVSAVGIRQCLSIPLEITVSGSTVSVLGVDIPAKGVALPDFDSCLANGTAVCVSNPPEDVSHLPLRQVGTPLDAQQVIIPIQRKKIRVKGTFCLTRSGGERGSADGIFRREYNSSRHRRSGEQKSSAGEDSRGVGIYRQAVISSERGVFVLGSFTAISGACFRALSNQDKHRRGRPLRPECTGDPKPAPS